MFFFLSAKISPRTGFPNCVTWDKECRNTPRGTRNTDICHVGPAIPNMPHGTRDTEICWKIRKLNFIIKQETMWISSPFHIIYIAYLVTVLNIFMKGYVIQDNYKKYIV